MRLARWAPQLPVLQSYSIVSIYPDMSENTPTGIFRNKASRYRKALAPLVPTIGLPQLAVLLAVAERPGASVNEIAELLEMPQQSASRAIAMLSGRYEIAGVMPEMLVDQGINGDDPRKRAITLTVSGERLVNRLLAATSEDEHNND
jgi:DNA-binding MarR family transcriptional regulator